MKVYLVDTENVGIDWLYLITEMNSRSRVVLFYTTASPCIPIGVLDCVAKKKVKVEYVYCVVGAPKTSALDFQLCTELGFRINQAPDNEYIIVSKDTDYDPVVNYWASRGMNVSRYAPLNMGIVKPVTQHQQDVLTKVDEGQPALAQPVVAAPAVKTVVAPAQPTKASNPSNMQKMSQKDAIELGLKCRCVLTKYTHIDVKDHAMISAIFVQAIDKPSPAAVMKSFTAQMESKFGKTRTNKYLSKKLKQSLTALAQQAQAA